MAFIIPNGYERFANEVFSRFRLLLSKNVFTGITQLTLREWLSNFTSDEEQYLAAHLLDALIYRTDLMVDSASQHVIEMILPNALKKTGFYYSESIDAFVRSLSSGDLDIGLRFVAVDGTFEEAPGKSGGQLIRQFSRSTGLNKSFLLRPENIGKLDSSVNSLIFIDDCIGTGSQFKRFCKAYKLYELSNRYNLIYIPLIAHPSGVEKINAAFPSVCIWPVEVLGRGSDFFSEDRSRKGIWWRDQCNSVIDVKNIYSQLMNRHGVSPESKFNLNLSIGFSFSTPNNTLKAYFSAQGTWKKLLVR